MCKQKTASRIITLERFQLFQNKIESENLFIRKQMTSSVISKATIILWLLLSLATVPQGKGVTRNTAVMKVVRNSNKTFPHYSRCLPALIAAVEATHYTESLITVTVFLRGGGEDGEDKT